LVTLGGIAAHAISTNLRKRKVIEEEIQESDRQQKSRE
jgi:heme exporter protein D